MLNNIASFIGVSPEITNSYESISTVTVGAGGSSSIDFTSIPSTYKHLQVRVLGQTSRTGFVVDGANLRINSDSGANYSNHSFIGGFTSSQPFVSADKSVSSTYINGVFGLCSSLASASMFGSGVLDILDYQNTNKYKTVRALSGYDINGTSGSYGGTVTFCSGLWMSTSAITSLTITPQTGGTVFNQYSSFALYGIKG